MEAQNEEPTFDEALVMELLSRAAANIKLTAGAAKTCGELLRLFVLEARDRAEAEARSEGDETIRPEHLEAALAELLADFS